MVVSRLEQFFGNRLVANYDRLMAPLERRVFGEARRRLVGAAAGRVLDVGAGTGANFSLFAAGDARVVALDPEPGMLERAGRKASGAAVDVALVRATAEALPFPDGCFDTVVATLVFCTIRRPAVALAEVRRVLRPGGRLLMLEHVRSNRPALGLVQDLLTPAQRVVAAGCHLNRPTLALVARGLAVTAVRERFASTIVEIEAVRAA